MTITTDPSAITTSRRPQYCAILGKPSCHSLNADAYRRFPWDLAAMVEIQQPSHSADVRLHGSVGEDIAWPGPGSHTPKPSRHVKLWPKLCGLEAAAEATSRRTETKVYFPQLTACGACAVSHKLKCGDLQDSHEHCDEKRCVVPQYASVLSLQQLRAVACTTLSFMFPLAPPRLCFSTTTKVAATVRRRPAVLQTSIEMQSASLL